MKEFFKLAAVAIFSLAFLVGCGSSGDKKESAAAPKTSIDLIKERGVVRIAVFSDKAPFGYVDSNGAYQGYDIYFAKRFAKDLLGSEDKVEFVPVEAAARVAILESGRADIVLANFTYTKERAEKVLFANPYFKTALGVVSKNGEIKSVEDLKGKKLIVNKGTTADIYFTKNYPEIELLKYDQNTEAFQALRDGRGIALAHDNALVFAWALGNEGFSVGIGSLGDVDAIAPAVKLGDTVLADWINNELVELGKESFALKAYDATLKPVYGDTINPNDLIVEGGKL
ncbi:MAG: cysteine ABC transporter substrate-binding protein [Campylobacteraceae bacterium]